MSRSQVSASRGARSPSARPTPLTRRHRPLSHLAFLLLVCGALGLPGGVARAGEIEDIPFADRIALGQTELPLFGLGLLRYRVLFRGYVGGLYLPPGVSGEGALEDVPKALELYYFWDIPGRFFGEAAEELLTANLPPERVAAMRSRLDRLHALYRDVEAGDRYRLSYLPGEGMTLRYNDRALGTIPGADFARDYFGIWLGEAPLSESFRDQILAPYDRARK